MVDPIENKDGGVTVRIPVSLADSIESEIQQRPRPRPSRGELLAEAWAAWKGKPKKTQSDPDPIEIQQTRKILESGDELAINAVRMTLRLCMGNVRAPKKKAV